MECNSILLNISSSNDDVLPPQPTNKDDTTKKKKSKVRIGGNEAEAPLSAEKSHSKEDLSKKKKALSSESLTSLVRNAKESNAFYTPPEEVVTPVIEPVFSSRSYKDADVHPFMVSNLEQSFGITHMTEVQRLSIPELLAGKDVLIRSQTGSGKTLAYAIPIVHLLQKIRPKICREDGTRALIVLPTRELAIQTYECFQKLIKSFTWLVPGCLVGGEKRKSEKARIRKGITILVGTPGRLLDHALSTQTLSFHNLTHLILDEADRLLDLGYEKDIKKLMEIIESHWKERSNSVKMEKKQTVLLSATLTRAVEHLAGLAMTNPKRIDAADTDMLNGDSNQSEPHLLVIPESLSQHYLICPARLRLVSLAAILTHFLKVEGCTKILIFMATQDMVDYHTSLFQTVTPSNIPSFKLHGSMTQIERTEVFKNFRSCSSGVLICTDVGARGLDLPKVDCIVQYTAPTTPADYVHRVGRTGRIGNKGSAVLCLTPAEISYIDVLSSKRIKINEYDLGTVLDSIFLLNLESDKKLRDLEDAASWLQLKFEQALLEDKELHDKASIGYKSFVRFYSTYPKDYREVFNFKNLHLGHYAKSFALRDAPSAMTRNGKPGLKKFKSKEKGRELKRKPFTSEFRKPHSQTISEYDSGIKFKNKKK